MNRRAVPAARSASAELSELNLAYLHQGAQLHHARQAMVWQQAQLAAAYLSIARAEAAMDRAVNQLVRQVRASRSGRPVEIPKQRSRDSVKAQHAIV